MMAGSAVRMLLQAVYFILIARSLGPGQYGIFVGAISLIAVLAPFSTWGTGNLLIRNVARRKDSFGDSWGTALFVTCVSGSLLLVVVIAVSHFIFSHRAPLTLILLTGLSDLVLASIVGLASQAYQAFEMLGRTAGVAIVLAGCRAIGALLMVFSISHPNAESWAVLYLISTCISAGYVWFTVCRRLGYPKFSRIISIADVRQGFYFSVGLSSQSVYNNIDKTMLVRLATADAAGIYATAYRIIDLSFQPIAALLYSTYARFFQHGLEGIHGTAKYAKRLLPFAMGYGILAGIALFLSAPLLPLVLGRAYVGADDVLRWLSPLIMFRAAHYLLSDALTGANFQGLRSIIQVGIAVFNIALDFWLIPAYSWRGAAWASLASDGLLAIVMYAAVVLLRTSANPIAPADVVQSETMV